jgi:hypothetical protein
MSLALYPSRVRSSDLLERTCHSFPKLIESLATTLSGGCHTSVTPDQRVRCRSCGKGCRRQPSGAISLTLTLDSRGSEPWTGLAIYLGGSAELGFRPGGRRRQNRCATTSLERRDIGDALAIGRSTVQAAPPQGRRLIRRQPELAQTSGTLTCAF